MPTLPEPTRAILAPFFARLDLAREEFETVRWPVHVPRARNKAYAGRRRIFIRAEYWDPYTAEGVALIAHELYHRQQRREMGNAAFEAAWLAGFIAAGFDAGQRNRLERPAYALERQVRRFIEASFVGGDIRNGPNRDDHT